MAGTILLERNLPLHWHVANEPNTTYTPEQNHLILGLLDTLEEPGHNKSESEHDSELKRIDAKLNLILQLLNQILQVRQTTQATVPVRFRSDNLSWQVQQPPAIGTRLQVSLYPEPSIPLAVHFEAIVVSNTDNWVEVDIQSLTEDEQAIWSRWIFRQHRRQVAQARTAAPSLGHSN